MNFLIPQGIGDAIWALLKVQDIAAKHDNVINLFIACIDKNNMVEARALEFVKRFKFVSSAQMYEMPMSPGQVGCILLPGAVADENGYYRYISDGETSLKDIDYVLMPNAALERGIRLEDWLPEYKTNWRIMEDFSFDDGVIIDKTGHVIPLKEYVIFYLSSLSNNSSSGHNRNNIWSYADWVTLGKYIQEELKCKIVVVGADYDRSYFTDYIKPLLSDEWIDLIGNCGIGETFAIVKNARFVISYQSGIGIVANYMGIPAGIFWRQKGDSISPDSYISFEEKMAEAWVNPAMIEQNKYMPLIYGRHDVNYITTEIKKRAW